MNIKPIRNDDDLRDAFERLEAIFQAAEGSPLKVALSGRNRDFSGLS